MLLELALPLLLALTSSAQTTASPTTTTLPTLQSGWYFIRAVETPAYHSYLQTIPSATPGPAYLSSNTNAGQFNIISGQLVYNTGASQLYMNVEDPVNKTQRTLQTWFNKTQNQYGTFGFQGDAVTWTVSDIARPNVAAWYVCGDQGQLYINTGAYGYQTPAGCYDETIHSYGGSTPTV
ncbi:hypothetical protein Asppvi_010433 [Aspergillus pseudoviridinutans]|uniref:Uncharacterized protein n=1 Tax=Aspergillus pseudoviridinutans TaxID=1517512 RepID=A0A9P3BHW9_9EURO|nr:uncharacterized protein Asppvi_010433 [Aspergillus pseudoviridinutans]GIJ91467.1 hypothetical protein Asppvi_010433 [Aspergillus pseudoviridinutans]